jgi:hypothetical protein
MKWIKTIWRRFVGLFSPSLADALTSGISAASAYLPEIYQVVRWVAQMTPTRADDEIIAVAERLGVPAVLDAPDRGEALARMVIAWAMQKWPGVPVRRIRRAIEIAYGAIRP